MLSNRLRHRRRRGYEEVKKDGGGRQESLSIDSRIRGKEGEREGRKGEKKMKRRGERLGRGRVEEKIQREIIIQRENRKFGAKRGGKKG